MKKTIVIIAALFCTYGAQCQSEKFTAAMKSTIAAIDTSFANPLSLLGLANRFERIALAEKNQWLPYYYAAYCQVNYGFMQAKDPSGLDAIADRADVFVQKADSLSPANSEVSTIKAMIATIRMIVNPMQRYMEYGPIIDANIEKAKAQDPGNPRPYWFKGENLKNTPAQFGGGCGPALPQLKTAKEKFDSFKPLSDIHPGWGLQRTETLLNECK